MDTNRREWKRELAHWRVNLRFAFIRVHSRFEVGSFAISCAFWCLIPFVYFVVANASAPVLHYFCAFCALFCTSHFEFCCLSRTYRSELRDGRAGTCDCFWP